MRIQIYPQRAFFLTLILVLSSQLVMFSGEEINPLESIVSGQYSPVSDQQAWEWAIGGGSSYDDAVKDMIVLPNGEVYLAGIFRSSITIGTCNANMAVNSNTAWFSIFVAKFAINGSCSWINTVSGLSNVPSDWDLMSITSDQNDDLFMVSRIGQGGTYHFGNLSQALSYGFIAKLNNNGSWDWVTEPAAIPNTDASITVDSQGQIWTAWSDKIVRHNSMGQYQSEYDFCSSACMKIQNFFFDNSDELYVSGYIEGYLSITVNGTSENYVSPTDRLFIMKINSSGDTEWFSTASAPTSSSMINSATMDSNGDISVTGSFYGYMELDSSSLSSGGQQRGFVAKLNSTGDWLWGLKIDGSGTVIPHDVDIFNNVGILVTGKYSGMLNSGSISLNQAAGNSDVFVLRISSQGTPQWGLTGGSSENDHGFKIGSSNSGHTYVSGDINENSAFGSNTVTGVTSTDFFLAKLSPDYDEDGESDVKDSDDDDDFILDVMDACRFSPLGFQSIGSFDHDSDGCRDSDEDADDDGDGVEDNSDSCAKGMVGWIANLTNDIDQDGCMDSLEDMDDDADGFEDYDDLCPRDSGNSTYVMEKGCMDTDGDSRPDIRDPFPFDDQEWNDLDFDGVGDNADAFDTDPTQHSDADGDGHGDNPFGFEGDWFPSDPTRWKDSDQDGVADEDDAFPNEPTQVLDSDGDGYGDDPYGERGDEFPDDPNEWADSDGDGVGDNADAFPFNPSQQFDSDGDGFGDNQRGSSADRFPNDPTQWSDIDGDGFGDNVTGNNPDIFPTDPTQHSDRDGDGYGDDLSGRLADLFPDNPTQWEDADGDGLGDNQSGTNPDLHLFDFDNDGYIDALDILPMLASPGDLDADGCPDEVDVFDDNPRECYDFDNDTIGDNEDTDDDGDGWSDTEEDRLGTDPKDPLSVPVDSFEVVIPGTSVGLGAWDLIGMLGGIPLFLWLAFGFVTRNSRTARFENRLREARTRDELETIALDWEYAMMMRLIGPHQGIRLERIRVELDDNMESMNQSLSSLKPDGDDQTHLVVAEMEQQGKIRESDLMDSDTPSKEMTGSQGDDGYEWLDHNGRQYYRQVNEPASDWEEWNASP